MEQVNNCVNNMRKIVNFFLNTHFPYVQLTKARWNLKIKQDLKEDVETR